MTVAVVAAEASGGRMVAQALADVGAPTLHRSYPHGGQWPDLATLNPDSVVVVVRDWWPTVHAQIAAGHQPGIAAAQAAVMDAYDLIFGQCGDWKLTPTIVTYAGWVARPAESLFHLAAQVGHPCNGLDAERATVHVGDADAKYYGGPEFHADPTWQVDDDGFIRPRTRTAAA